MTFNSVYDPGSAATAQCTDSPVTAYQDGQVCFLQDRGTAVGNAQRGAEPPALENRDKFLVSVAVFYTLTRIKLQYLLVSRKV